MKEFTNIENAFDHVLHTIASHYMTHYQGDIIVDYRELDKQFKENGSVEMYFSKMHFYCGTDDEEINKYRFDFCEYKIKLTACGDKLKVEVFSNPKYDIQHKFPVERWLMEKHYFCQIYLNGEKMDFIEMF